MSGQSNRYLSPEQAKRFYDRLGSRQDWQGFFENPAFNEVIAHAAFESAHSVFEFGCGTGKLAARLFKHHLPADARYVGLDIRSTMVLLSQARLRPWLDRARVHQSDGSQHIAEADRSFDRFVSTYVFDLLAPDFIDQLLSEAYRVLTPEGKLCLVSLTLGGSGMADVVSRLWERLWRFSPGLVGGCHPIELSEYLRAEFWTVDYRRVVTTWELSSDVIVAQRRQP